MELKNAVRAVLVALVAVLLAPTPATAATPQHPPAGGRATGFYVALGDSLAAGYQPGVGDDRTGGYTGRVLDSLRQSRPRTRLVNLSCSGETTTTMMRGGVCAYDERTQLAQAVEFLHAHARHTELVTIDVGANDVQRCVRAGVLDRACVQAGLGAVATNLPRILSSLRRAAPRVRIVVLNYYDPFLAAWLTGPDGQQLAQLSVALGDTLNGIIAVAAGTVGAPVADVATAFRTHDWRLTTLPGAGQVPTSVATICTWTWMCTRGDIHANDAGYAVMAAAVVAT